MGAKEGLMTLLRTAFVAAGIALAMSFPAFAEEPGASTSPSEAAPPAPDSGKDDLTAEERAEKQARKACIQKHRCFYALREMCPDICEYPKDLCYKTCDEQETPGTAKMKSCKASCIGLPREVCPDGSPPQ